MEAAPSKKWRGLISHGHFNGFEPMENEERWERLDGIEAARAETEEVARSVDWAELLVAVTRSDNPYRSARVRVCSKWRR